MCEYISFDQLPVMLQVKDVAAVLSVGQNTAYELVRSGQIPSVRIGGIYRISKDALVDYIKKSS